MKRLFATITWVILLCYVPSAGATSLDEALTQGYEYNENLKTIRTNFLEEIESFPRALANFMPRISAGVDIADANTKYKSTNTTVDSSTYARSLTLEQPIFSGFSSVFMLKAAQSSFRAATANYYVREQEVFLRLIDIYLSCVEAYEKHNISEVSVRSNKMQLLAAQEKLKLGEATETEVASAMAGLAIAEAKQAAAYANLEARKAQFTQNFGLAAQEIKLPDLLAHNTPTSPDELTNIAIKCNPTINYARHSIMAAQASEQAAKGDLLPKATFRLQGAIVDYRPKDPRPGGVSGNDNKSLTSTLSIVVPILGKGGIEYSDIRRAKYQTKKSMIELDNLIKQTKANSKTLCSEQKATQIEVDATMQAVKAAEIAYLGMQQEEMLGSKTIIDVLNAEEKLFKAKEALVEANKMKIFVAYKIKALKGELTAKSMNLKVKPFEPEKEFKKVKTKIISGF